MKVLLVATVNVILAIAFLADGATGQASPPPPPTGLAITDANAKIAFGPNSECILEYKPGPPPYLESNCPIVSPPPSPSPGSDNT